ncbi:MAG: prenyltransferase/squalene oxidase repeat-containing protein [Tepidisphaerales bacterium]
MLTLRHLERLWNHADYPRMARELLAGRMECSPRALVAAAHRVPSAAWGLIRLDEYARPDHPLAQRFLHALLVAQREDGGWGEDGSARLSDPITTALVLRALATSSGRGVAIDRGLAYLKKLQNDDGGFPAVPLPGSASDPDVTAVVLHHLRQVPAAAEWGLCGRPQVAPALTAGGRFGPMGRPRGRVTRRRQPRPAASPVGDVQCLLAFAQRN